MFFDVELKLHIVGKKEGGIKGDQKNKVFLFKYQYYIVPMRTLNIERTTENKNMSFH